MSDDIPGGPLDSRAIGDLEKIMESKEGFFSPNPKQVVWIRVTAWCPLCWWRYGPEEFHVQVDAYGVMARMRKQHRTDKPNCHETIRIEGK